MGVSTTGFGGDVSEARKSPLRRVPITSSEAPFRRRDDAHREAHVRTIYYYAIYYPAVELITAFGMAVVLGIGGT
ncbi:MAG: hypothetical protein AAFY88_14485, partial [Acidobacteriota bacterium]